MRFPPNQTIVMLAALALTACSAADDPEVDVAFIGAAPLIEDGVRLTIPAQHVRAAISEGLVRFDADGQVIPGLAERWIVTDDGASYIFRLRNTTWPDGSPITAGDVRASLLRTMRELRGTTLGLDLEDITEIRAMTGRVIEIRLQSAMPQFLQLLAQAELGIRQTEMGGTDGLGPMQSIDRSDDGLRLSAIIPERRGLPAQQDWEGQTREVRIRTMQAEAANAAFSAGEVDLVVGGRLADLPFADTGPLTRGTVRLDPAIGLFGLDVMNVAGFFADNANREAIALAIGRADLLEPFSIGGWTSTTRIVPASLPGFTALGEPRWSDLDRGLQVSSARQRILLWEANSGEPLQIRISLPEGPGSDRLFLQLVEDLAAAGADAIRVRDGEPADLRLRDRVARYLQPRWFLNQFNCAVAPRQCSREADALVAQSLAEPDPEVSQNLMAEAEALILERNMYIPLGAPVRWSLVRANLVGYADNALNVHPLFPLSGAPI